MSTALQVIQDALSKAGILSPGDVVTADELNDALRAFNDLLENTSLERQGVYGRTTEQFVTQANVATYTIGPGGAWNTTRPVRIASPGYSRLQGIDYGLDVMGDNEYALITLKTQPGIPRRFNYVNDTPLGVVTLWPVPDQVYTIGLNTDRVLTSIPSLNTVLAFPPGYELMFKCLLADLLAPEYGTVLPQAVAEQARRFKADIKRANRKKRVARFDDVPSVQGGVGFYDWRGGA
jgi:hypothetical protein